MSDLSNANFIILRKIIMLLERSINFELDDDNISPTGSFLLAKQVICGSK